MPSPWCFGALTGELEPLKSYRLLELRLLTPCSLLCTSTAQGSSKLEQSLGDKLHIYHIMVDVINIMSLHLHKQFFPGLCMCVMAKGSV